MKCLFDSHTGLRAILSKLSGLPAAYIQTPPPIIQHLILNEEGFAELKNTLFPKGSLWKTSFVVPLHFFILRLRSAALRMTSY